MSNYDEIRILKSKKSFTTKVHVRYFLWNFLISAILSAGPIFLISYFVDLDLLYIMLIVLGIFLFIYIISFLIMFKNDITGATRWDKIFYKTTKDDGVVIVDIKDKFAIEDKIIVTKDNSTELDKSFEKELVSMRNEVVENEW